MQLRLVHSTSAPSGKCHAAPFVFSDLTFDISAIKLAAKARYIAKLDRIFHRYWHWNIARRAFRETWREARDQLHKIVWSQIPRELPYTPEEVERLMLLGGRMATAPVSLRGNIVYKAAAGEYGQTVANAQRRAYRTVLANARGR